MEQHYLKKKKSTNSGKVFVSVLKEINSYKLHLIVSSTSGSSIINACVQADLLEKLKLKCY